MKKPNCIGTVTVKDDGYLKYTFCRLQFWKYRPMRLYGHPKGALSYGAYRPEYDEDLLKNSKANGSKKSTAIKE